MWRLARNIIPTRCNLRRRGVVLDTVCPLCFDADESSNHLFMACPMTLQVWFASPLGFQPPPQTDLNAWLQSWLSAKEPLAVQLFCVCLWKIWFFRNQAIFNQVVFEPRMVAASAHDFVSEFNLGNPTRSVDRLQIPAQVWITPPTDFLKANIDAGRDKHGKVTWGLVIRNHESEVLFAATQSPDIMADPLLAETLGLRWGIQTVLELQLSNVMFELDASVVVKCFNGLSTIASISPFISDCHDLFGSLVGSSVSFVNRSCNVAAHELAQAAKSIGSRTWVGNAPLKVWSLFSLDLFL
ncbi:uncharacterized protein [Medicago truncatula]|uniref:uncharacterized protein n=1 Tax=Medicago truncatula TaxID=3880 RepID=UPI000D2F2E6C|nr:uncharacterized protein LOC112417530 [Medicago truncatula]